MPVKPNTTKDKFGDDLMIKAETTPQGADDAAKIIAVSLIRKSLSGSCAMLDFREPRPKHSWPGDTALYPCVMLRMWMPH